MEQFPFSPSFKFDCNLWRRTVTDSISVPLETSIHLWVDPAYFSDEKSNDQSAMAVTFKITDDYGTVLVVKDAAAGWFKGLALPDKIAAMAHAHHVDQIHIERCGNGAPDLLEETIELRAQQQGITLGHIIQFSPNNKNGAKRRRVYRLQSLLENDPPFIRLCTGPYIPSLLQQVRNFCFDTDENHRREDGLLDVLALAAFGR